MAENIVKTKYHQPVRLMAKCILSSINNDKYSDISEIYKLRKYIIVSSGEEINRSIL